MSDAIDIRPEAQADLDDHAEYIARDKLTAARRFLKAAHETFDRLAEMPGLGSRRRFKNSDLTGVRMWPIPGFLNYLVFYRETNEGIEVLRVLHGAQDRRRILGDEG